MLHHICCTMLHHVMHHMLHHVAPQCYTAMLHHNAAPLMCRRAHQDTAASAALATREAAGRAQSGAVRSASAATAACGVRCLRLPSRVARCVLDGSWCVIRVRFGRCALGVLIVLTPGHFRPPARAGWVVCFILLACSLVCCLLCASWAARRMSHAAHCRRPGLRPVRASRTLVAVEAEAQR